MTHTVTIEGIESKIVHEEYHQIAGTSVTICLLKLENGFTVIGESACVDPERFDADLGKEIARKNAIDKVWALEGYLLAEDIYRGNK